MIMFLTLKRGIPIGMSRALASFERETMHPSLFERTTTGLVLRSGLKTRSHETKKLLQSITAIIVF